MIPAALIALASTVGGAMLTYLYDLRATLSARLCAGAAIGSALLGFAGYLACAVVGRMNAPSLVFAVAVACQPLLLLLVRPDLRARVQKDLAASLRIPSNFRRRRFAYTFVGASTVALLCWLFRGTAYLNPAAGGLWTNNHHNIGDLPWHVAVVEGFLRGENFPPQHPEFAGARLTYPFLMDFLHAQYMQAGASLAGAALLQNILFSVALLGLFYRWAFLLTRRVFAALVAPLLVLFSGGCGFVYFFSDHQPGQTWLALLRNLPHDYTRDDSVNLKWGNALTVLLTTQRSLLLAIPFALIVATLWWQDRQHPTGRGQMPRLAWAGFFTGLLPLVHGHTYLTLLLVGAGLAFQDLLAALHTSGGGIDFRSPALGERFRSWLWFFGLALLLAVPQALVIKQVSSIKMTSFIGWQPGWDCGDVPLIPFYLWNLGAFIPLLLVTLIARRWGSLREPLVGHRLLRFYSPFLICFLVPNLLRLAPWIWDNMKMLLYWHIASSVVIAAALARLWDARRFRLVARVLILGLVAALTFAGALDVARIGQGTLRQQTYDPEGMAFAEEVVAATPPHALLLHYPSYNHPVTLTGRRLLCGYDGHLWSHGFDFAARKADVVRMFAGAPDARELLAKYKVDYVVVGPLERGNPNNLGVVANEAFFTQFPVAVRRGPWTLYRVGDDAPVPPP